MKRLIRTTKLLDIVQDYVKRLIRTSELLNIVQNYVKRLIGTSEYLTLFPPLHLLMEKIDSTKAYTLVH